MSAKSGQKPGKDNFTRNLVIGMVALVAIILVAKPINDAVNPREISQAIPAAANADNDNSISFNTELAGVPVIDIYEDAQCPVCKEFESINTSYLQNLVTSKQATVNYHFFSFIGQESIDAASAAACASDQSKFLEFHKALYENQPSAENSGELDSARLIEIGAIAGVTGSTFESCVKDLRYEAWAQKASIAAEKAGVTGTPTVFINGKKLESREQLFTAAGFKAAVEG